MVGWHAKHGEAPHRGRGTATVEPLRKRNHIAAVKFALANSPRDRALFVFGINTGFRASDLLALTWGDILTETGDIVRTLPFVESKTGTNRRLPIAENARKALKAHLDSIGGIGGIELESPVFPSNRGGRLTVQRLHQMVNDWCSAAGIEGHFGTHTLRKTFGLHHYQGGMDIVQLMNCFGHSSPSITLRYIGLEQEAINQKILNLNL